MSSVTRSSPFGYRHLYISPSSSLHTPVFLFGIISLFTPVISSPVPNISSQAQAVSEQFYSLQKTTDLRITAATCATVSMLSSLVAFYWFARMRKRFRHRLIMILVFGDVVRALSYFLQAVVSIDRGTVSTESAFCQSGGTLVQYGTETSDYAILVIALHNALQVFRPSSQLRSDGLYSYRYWVYVGAVAIPGTMSGLAFINPQWAYLSLGAFCTLPYRPFWYRLALTWIPRYIVGIIILGLAVAIYIHVGFEFRLLSSITVSNNQQHHLVSTTASPVEEPGETTLVGTSVDEQRLQSLRRGSSVVSFVGTSRRESVETALHSLPEDSSDTHQSYLPRSTAPAGVRRFFGPIRSNATTNSIKPEQAAPGTTSYDETEGSTLATNDRSTAQIPHNQVQRARVHRQLRLMFIYPVVYMLMWIFPFVYHCMMYNDYWASHPMYWLAFLSHMCVTSMGAIDSLIFSLRERPWRHIPSSDGSFLGSFICWYPSSTSANGFVSEPNRRPSAILRRTFTDANPETPHVEEASGWLSNVVRTSRDVRTSGSSDQARDDAQMARERLKIEKTERRAAWLRAGEARARTSTFLDTIESPEDEVVEYGFTEGDGIRTGDWVGGGGEKDLPVKRPGNDIESKGTMEKDEGNKQALQKRGASI